MLGLLIKKEILTSLRDSRVQVIASFLIILMVVAVFVGRQGQNQIQQEREKIQADMYAQWVNQGAKHPHSAAHYGQFVFKPKSTLSFLDIGLDNFTGVSVFLEAHQQHEILFSTAQDSNGMSRFGEMTIALILQMLMPLLIIFLTFNIFSKEREEGTLQLLQAQGISMKKLLLVKILGTYAIVLSIFLPIICLSYLLLESSSIDTDASIGIKFLFLLISYLLYFLVLLVLSTLISAFSKNSSISLLSLLGIWILTCIIIPKATTNLAEKIYPTPSLFDFQKNIQEKVENGIDGHNPSDERLAALKQSILEEYKVESIEELPVNWGGIAMQAGEEYTDKVYDQEFSNIEYIYIQQNLLSEWVAFVNPYLAIRHLSMAFAGTDFYHHMAFARAAEHYRRDFVKKLNKDMELNHKPDVSYSDYNVDKEMWESIHAFSFQSPNTTTILVLQWRSITALLLWLIMLFSIVFFLGSKISKL